MIYFYIQIIKIMNGYAWLCLLILAWIGSIITAFIICPPIGWFFVLLTLGWYMLIRNS